MYADNVLKIVELKHDKIREQLGQLNPTISSIRNTGRSGFFKTITGNLEHTDAERYDKIITDIASSQDRLKSAVLQQIQKKQSNQSLSDEFAIQLIIQQLLSNLQTIYDVLGTIENAITFAEMNVFHNSIIKAEDLLSALKIANNSLENNKFPLEPTKENLLELESIINVKCYYKQNKIIFLLELPLVSNYDFDFYTLLSIPVLDKLNNNYKTIIPRNKYLLLSEDYFAFTNIVCKKVKDKYFLL